jgi:REP element-mobilizing transposase RayT
MSEYLDPFEEIQKHGTKLPHWQQSDSMQFVTFRLGDAMPANTIRQWKEERAIWRGHHPEPLSPEDQTEYHRRFTSKLEHCLDEGSGSCLLKDPENRRILEEILMHDQSTRAIHHAWVIMPNHVHLIFTAHAKLEKLMKSWKGISARRIGKGSIWQKGYRDTIIRDGEHFANAIRYIRRNPTKLPPGTYSLRHLDPGTAKS